MAASTDRQAARERLSHVVHSMLDQMVPPDPAVPLAGGPRFVDGEDQGEALARALVPTFPEERAALDAAATGPGGARCPDCSSDRVYRVNGAGGGQVEVTTPFGPAVLSEQRCRCRACGRSFSPPGPSVGAGGRGEAVAQGGGPGGP